VARNLLRFPDPVRRPFSVLLAAALLPLLASALSGCPGTIEDSSRFQGRCRGQLDVQTEIFVARCSDSSCHDAQSPAAELDLISPNLERRLVGVRSTQCSTRLRIDRTEPERSYLLEKLEHDEQECGDRMPIAGDPLTRDEIACVRQWVERTAAQSSDDAAATQPDSGAGGG
jgi:hypothetical protein